MIGITASGTLKKTNSFLEGLRRRQMYSDFETYGRIGVAALQEATPVDSGATREAWDFRIVKDRRRPGILWINTNSANGTPVPILIQYGHGTGTGGYVEGIDFINPALKPVFDKIADDVWKKVKAL